MNDLPCYVPSLSGELNSLNVYLDETMERFRSMDDVSVQFMETLNVFMEDVCSYLELLDE